MAAAVSSSANVCTDGINIIDTARKRDRQHFPYFLKFIIKEILRLFEFITQKSPQTFHLWESVTIVIIILLKVFFNSPEALFFIQSLPSQSLLPQLLLQGCLSVDRTVW